MPFARGDMLLQRIKDAVVSPPISKSSRRFGVNALLAIGISALAGCDEEPVEPTNCGDAHVASTTTERLDADYYDPGDVGTDGRSVYYNARNGTLRRSLSGRERPTPVDRPMGLFVQHGSRLCFISFGSLSCSDDGGPPAVLRESFPSVVDFDFDETHIYWATSNQVFRAPLIGQSAAELLFETSETLQNLALSAKNLAFTATEFGAVHVCTKATCASDVRILKLFGRAGAVFVGKIALDDAFVYVPLRSDDAGRRRGTLVRIAINGGASNDLMSCQYESPAVVKLDGGRAIVLTHAEGVKLNTFQYADSGSVFSISTNGGTPTRLAADQPHPRYVAVTPDALFVVNNKQGGGELVRVAR